MKSISYEKGSILCYYQCSQMTGMVCSDCLRLLLPDAANYCLLECLPPQPSVLGTLWSHGYNSLFKPSSLLKPTQKAIKKQFVGDMEKRVSAGLDWGGKRKQLLMDSLEPDDIAWRKLVNAMPSIIETTVKKLDKLCWQLAPSYNEGTPSCRECLKWLLKLNTVCF